jgi:hypothetical protein
MAVHGVHVGDVRRFFVGIWDEPSLFLADTPHVWFVVFLLEFSLLGSLVRLAPRVARTAPNQLAGAMVQMNLGLPIRRHRVTATGCIRA